MIITLIQTDQQWEAPEINRLHIEKMIDTSGVSDIIVLPEMFPTGFVTRPEMAVEQADTVSLEWMRKVAASRNVAVVGSVAVSVGDKYLNRLYFVKPDSSFEYYDKRHLFSPGGENLHYTCGDRRVIVEYMGFRILLLVCYDLRFPVWSRCQNDYDLIINTASWAHPRIHVWDLLLRARAVENQCYVAGVNRVGDDPYDHYCGHSAVIDFLGHPLAEGIHDCEGVITAELSLAELNSFRTRFPAWKDADKFTLL